MREAGKDYADNGTPFFIAYGTFKPHTPFIFPERFLDYYPEEVIQLPPNPYVPVNMPEKAWSDPPIFRQFDDLIGKLQVNEKGKNGSRRNTVRWVNFRWNCQVQ